MSKYKAHLIFEHGEVESISIEAETFQEAMVFISTTIALSPEHDWSQLSEITIKIKK